VQQVSAHVELDAAGQDQRAVVDLRPARHDLDVEAAIGVGAVRDRLVEAAMLGSQLVPKATRPSPPAPTEPAPPRRVQFCDPVQIERNRSAAGKRRRRRRS
jgi:hypothetical protein